MKRFEVVVRVPSHVAASEVIEALQDKGIQVLTIQDLDGTPSSENQKQEQQERQN